MFFFFSNINVIIPVLLILDRFFFFSSSWGILMYSQDRGLVLLSDKLEAEDGCFVFKVSPQLPREDSGGMM